MPSHPITVTAYYNFVAVPEYASYQPLLQDFCAAHGIKGIILLAPEGINSTIAGSAQAIAAYKIYLTSLPPFAATTFKDSWAQAMPFRRLKVRLKKEIVTMGQEGLDPRTVVGTYVKPQAWNALISDPEVTVVDTRNDYEVALGTFKNALDPRTFSFRQFADYVEKNLDPHRHKKIAMFCTGGIRCEKSTAFMLKKGFKEVYHLEGGILKYLEEIPPEESTWEGACFVFDERVAVEHGLEVSHHTLCRGCRMPMGVEDKQSPFYEEGVSCPACYPTRSEKQRQGARVRHQQMQGQEQRQVQV